MGNIKNSVSFLLNGEKVELKSVGPKDLLIDYLRSPEVNFTGTKLSCGEGGCGACTVIWSKYDFEKERIVETPVNSCLRPLCSLDGTAITTIEGLPKKGVGPLIEDNLVKSCGSQCGYCSPGFVMTMYGLIKKDRNPDSQSVEDQFGGNICRCTGYISILNGMHKTAEMIQSPESLLNPNADHTLSPSDFHKPEKMEIESEGSIWHRPGDIREVLDLLEKYQPVFKNVKIVQGNTSIGIYKADVENPNIYIDVSALEGWRNISTDTMGVHLSGGVTIGQLLDHLNLLLAEKDDPALRGIRALRDHMKQIAGVQVRGAASVSGSLMMVKNHETGNRPFPGDLYTVFTTLGASISYITPDGKKHRCLTGEFPAIAMFPSGFLITEISIPFNGADEYIYTARVARRVQNAHPIVNAGFKCTVSDQGDISALKIVYGGIARTAIELIDTEKLILDKKGMKWNDAFFKAAIALIREEIERRFVEVEKAGIENNFKKELTVNLFYKFYVFVAHVIGLRISENELSALDQARPVARGFHDLFPTPFYEIPQVSAEHAIDMFTSPLLKKISITPILNLESVAPDTSIALQVLTADIGKDDPLKIDSPAQVSGRAKYTHDLDVSADTLNGYYVYSENRNSVFTYRNGKDGLFKILEDRFPGTHYITHEDIPNPHPDYDKFDPAYPSYYDPIFADGITTCYGQPIGLVVARDLHKAREAAEYIQLQLDYKPGPIPTISSMQEARDKKSLLIQQPGKFDQGMAMIFKVIPDSDSDKAEKTKWMDNPDQIENKTFVKGVQQTGAQYHFYMEPQGALAIPKEDEQIEVFASTQNQASCQKRIAKALGRSLNNVKVGTTRLGGGFGGKELRQVYVAAAAAVAAVTINKPVRLLLNRNVDMRMQGTRHPFDGSYYVVADGNGKIERVRIDYESDGGHSFDCSYPVMDLALLCAENAYDVDVFKSTGKVYRTNFQSRTAFRSFGLVQSMLITENAIEHLAFELGKVPEDIRKLNFYRDGIAGEEPPKTPYGSKLKFGRINKVWDKFREQVEFDRRLSDVNDFNGRNKWKKRGISMIPLNYGISYTFRPMNQGSAYVMVYKEDGSVMLHHGGVEMGQGIHTKMAQIASCELEIDISKIRIGGTNTAIIPNVSSTGASTGSDLNGGAVQMACRALKQNLLNFIVQVKADKGKPATERKFPDINDKKIDELSAITKETWKEKWGVLVSAMSSARQSLSAQYSYGSPKLGVVGPTNDGTGNNQIDNPDSQVFYYYNNCVAASEVEIDVLTGKFEILRSDIVYDAGDSLNDFIDIGQIEGGFIQGVGCLTTEEMLYAEDGRVVSDGTWEYKPPCSKTIPQQFNVWLLKYVKSGNAADPLKDTYGINSSKSTGEPPLVLANTVFFAIKHAIIEARKESGNTEWFELSAPATVQKIQQLSLSALI